MMVSDLEQRRLENIDRNTRLLAELGINSPQASKLRNASKKRKADVVSSTPKQETLPSRRSSRIASLGEVNYKEENVPTFSIPKHEKVSDGGLDSSGVNSTLLDIDVGKFTGSSSIPATSEISTSGLLTANTSTFITTYLGICVPDFGKASVMQIANNGVVPRFNKYSGVAEWSNALFLWVNLDGNSYTNTFTNSAQHMMWYGGSKMHKDSRIVARLQSNVDKFLFVRREGENYCCLGRVDAVAADYDAQPIAIKWQIRDYDTLASTSEYFQEILRQLSE